MKLSINRKSLLNVLKLLNGAVEARPNLPIWTNVLVQCDEVATFTICNAEVRIKVNSDAKVIEPGACTIPAKKLKAVVSSFHSEEVTIEATENSNNVKISHASSQITLVGMPPANYPKEMLIDTVSEITIKASELKDLINKVAFAVSPDDSRRVLTGVLLQVKDKIISTVSTDGKRLAIQEYATTADNIEGVVIPKSSMILLKNLLVGDEEISLKIGKQACSFATENFDFRTKLIEGNYPEYLKVIPSGFSNQAVIPVAECIQKTEAVKLMLSDTSEPMYFDLEDNKLTLMACSAMLGEGVDSMLVNYSGEKFEFAFNPCFWLEVFKNVGTEVVTLKFNTANDPFLFLGPEGFRYICMPVRRKQDD